MKREINWLQCYGKRAIPITLTSKWIGISFYCLSHIRSLFYIVVWDKFKFQKLSNFMTPLKTWIETKYSWTNGMSKMSPTSGNKLDTFTQSPRNTQKLSIQLAFFLFLVNYSDQFHIIFAYCYLYPTWG